MEQAKTKTGLVVSAHSADFIWRSGGAIALYASRGWQITVVCLTFGEKGESQKLWKDPSMTLDRVKTERRAEEVWDTKRKAFESMDSQEHLWDYYTRVGLQRGVQGPRNSERKMKYGEAYQRVFPLVTGEFV
jgi:LmbE family N-acetylglucosaminyl deacetylase